MSSTSEKGHAKNVANLETLITTCVGFGSNYNPTNPVITIPVLAALHTETKLVLKTLKITETAFNDVEGQRKLAFKPLKPLATKILGSLQSCGAPSTVITDALTINRKIQGKRANNALVEPSASADAPKDQISVSQQSFDMQMDHLEKLIELVILEPKYSPNENSLKTDTLNNFSLQLETINTAVKNAAVPYSNALIARDKKLYDPQTGLIFTALTAKKYVKSVFGASSPEFKLVNKISFKSR
jgi:hypothetical protein